jgi:hypothetical protein
MWLVWWRREQVRVWAEGDDRVDVLDWCAARMYQYRAERWHKYHTFRSISSVLSRTIMPRIVSHYSSSVRRGFSIAAQDAIRNALQLLLPDTFYCCTFWFSSQNTHLLHLQVVQACYFLPHSGGGIWMLESKLISARADMSNSGSEGGAKAGGAAVEESIVVSIWKSLSTSSCMHILDLPIESLVLAYLTQSIPCSDVMSGKSSL